MTEKINIPKKNLHAWMKMEDEHSKSPRTQERIVMQHIREHGMGYYPALRKMEAKLPRR